MPDVEPYPEEKLWDQINEALGKFSVAEGHFFDMVQVLPERWRLSPWGDSCGGFWVVGLMGHNVVWYNEIEDGFNISRYRKYGEIDQYYCNQDDLLTALQDLMILAQTGMPPGKAGPPMPI